MNSVIVLMSKEDNMFKVEQVFADWDLATLICAKKNQLISTDNKMFSYYYLIEIPFNGKVEASDFEVYHLENEIFINDGNGNEIIGTVELENDVIEELYHEECPPRKIPSYNVKSITICGTDLKNLKISKELTTMIEHEADNYRDKMIERIGEPNED